MRPGTHRHRVLLRVLAAMTFVAQVLVVMAPLVDVHPAPGTAGLAFSGIGVTATVAPQRDEAPQHDAMRCPGCIVHSIHALPRPSVVTPLSGLELRIAAVTGGARWVTVRPPSSHLSRAPPSIG